MIKINTLSCYTFRVIDDQQQTEMSLFKYVGIIKVETIRNVWQRAFIIPINQWLVY